MGLDAIVEEIKAKGRAEADKINQETSLEVSKIIADARAGAARIKAVRNAEKRLSGSSVTIRSLTRENAKTPIMIAKKSREKYGVNLFALALFGPYFSRISPG